MEKSSLPEIEECLEMLMEYAEVQPTEEVYIANACGMVLAEDVTSQISVPPYPKSAMDGYAVRAADLAEASGVYATGTESADTYAMGTETAGTYAVGVYATGTEGKGMYASGTQTAGACLDGIDREHPAQFAVKGKLMAGDYDEIPYEKNTTIRVMTGAFIPDGYDAVVRQEDTDYGEDTVEIYTIVKPFMNYCKTGEDIREGQTLMEAGTRLTPLHIGLLAEVGREKVCVRKPLRVAILCTGSELANVGQSLQPGKIYNNISYILSSAIRREGLEVSLMQICEDEEDILLRRLKKALEVSDMVITTGGVSVGQKDLIPEVLEKLGADILFRKANIQPGTPTTGSVKDGKIILSLSGNPYAAMVNFEIYFWPLAAKMMCHESFGTESIEAVLKTPYPKKNHARRFLRAFYENGEVTLPTSVHASSVIANMTQCNCYIDLEKGREVQVGEKVRVRLIKGQ